MNKNVNKNLYSIFAAVAALIVFACDNSEQQVPAEVKPVWTQMPEFPGAARDQAFAFCIGNKFYVGSGIGDNVIYQPDFYEFDPATSQWTERAEFPGGVRQNMVGFSVNGKGYAGLGMMLHDCNPICEIDTYTDLWEYDPSTDNWKEIGSYEILKNAGGCPLVVDDKVYLIVEREIWKFDPVNKSLEKASEYPIAFDRFSGFKIGNLLYYGTGYADDPSTPLIFDPRSIKSFFEFNPATGEWTNKADLAGDGRYWPDGFSLDGKGYFTFGQKTVTTGNTTTFVFVNDTWQYDPVKDSWLPFDSYPGKGRTNMVFGSTEEITFVGSGTDKGSVFKTKDFWMLKK